MQSAVGDCHLAAVDREAVARWRRAWRRATDVVGSQWAFISALYRAFCEEETGIGIRDAQTMNRTKDWSVRYGQLMTAAALLSVAWSAVAAPEAERQKVASANVGFAFKLLKEVVKGGQAGMFSSHPMAPHRFCRWRALVRTDRRRGRWRACWEQWGCRLRL